MKVVHTLAEYEEALKHLAAIDHTHQKLYRGQQDDWELLPNLFRRYRDKVDQIHPKEKDSLEKLKRRIPWDTPLIPKNDWDWLSFGQHFGMKTRMLDWSEKPLIALYFSVESPPIKPTVYIYHAQKAQYVDDAVKKTSFVTIEKTRIMKPSVHSVRVQLQKGWHTVHHLHPRKAGGTMVIPLADMKWHKGRMLKISIDPQSASNIRQELARKGIHKATVYGEFEKVCAAICSECFK